MASRQCGLEMLNNKNLKNVIGMRYFLFEILLLIFFSWVVLQMEPTAWLVG